MISADTFRPDQRTMASDRTWGEPPPVPNDGPSVHDELMADIASRKAFGLAKYGTTLQPGNGRDALKDALEEMLDLACYLKQWQMERDALRAQVQDLATENKTLRAQMAGMRASEQAKRQIPVEIELSQLREQVDSYADLYNGLAVTLGGGFVNGTDAELLSAVAELVADRDRFKADHLAACKTIAEMHAAATGRIGEGPIEGVVEDVATVRRERAFYRHEARVGYETQLALEAELADTEARLRTACRLVEDIVVAVNGHRNGPMVSPLVDVKILKAAFLASIDRERELDARVHELELDLADLETAAPTPESESNDNVERLKQHLLEQAMTIDELHERLRAA